MKVSDYIARFLDEKGIKDVFVLTGGCIVHVIDSVARNNIRYIPVQHEQASAMAADAYSRIKGINGTTLSTSGPGATNLLTGICCSYYDSIPTIHITGQVPSGDLKRESKSRQIGFQETDVISIYNSVTKYASLVDDPNKIRYELEKAFHIANSGRMGPVLLDICDDVQRAEVNVEKLTRYEAASNVSSKNNDLESKVMETIRFIEKAERPVVILGGGIRLGGALSYAIEFVKNSKLPYSLTWSAMDYLSHNSENFVGSFGVTSPRYGNFAVQNSDLIIAIGTRLDSHETGPKPRTFARDAKKIVIDIDSSELDKYESRGMHIDLPINTDVKNFLCSINSNLDNYKRRDLSDWTKCISNWKKRYPICLPEYYNQPVRVNPYVFIDTLSRLSKEGDVITTDCGSNLIWAMQSFKIKEGQRLISAFNHSPMGYSLPASMGAAIAANKPVTCITGDGGFQINIQELATIQRHSIPTRIFVLNNHGHGIIQGTLDNWLDGRYHATRPEFGLPDPDYVKIANAYGLKAFRINNHKELENGIKRTLSHDGPIVCEVDLLCQSQIYPKLLYGKPIEDSSPLLPREEFKNNMIVKPLEN